MPEEQDQAAVQEARSKVSRAYAAFQKYRLFSQQQIDEVVEAMAEAGRANARRLAELAVEETGYGNVKDKIAKNLLNADLLARTIRGMKTVGLLREIPDEKIVEVGVPCGVVAAVVPCTNPTSTVIYKVLIALKAGNTIVISPHPRAVRCTRETAEVLYQAARKAGAPEDSILCLENPTLEATQALMRHEHTAVILATGGHGVVRAAYSSGKPAFGVGPGNVPALIDTSFPVGEAVAGVVEGKAFDYGTVCSSEQTLVAERSLREPILAALREQRAYLCSEEEREALARVLVRPNLQINPECVGQAPTKLARMAGFEVPPDTSILVAELAGVGKEHPLSVEKLSPVLAVRFVRDFEEALQTCEAVLRFGGMGHTCVIWSKDEERIRIFGLRMPAFRVLVNTPGPHGSVGITTKLMPSMTLGCGAMGGNSTSDNVGPQHLINIKRIAWKVREAAEALPLPPYEEERRTVEQPASAIAAADRAAIAAIVEQYLRERGLAPVAPSAPVAAAEIVERFLSSRGKLPASCPMQGEVCPGAATSPTALPAQPTPPAQPVFVADFVCEADVRAAIQQGRKIFIGPRTIVTPAARDLGEQHGVLVMTQG